MIKNINSFKVIVVLILSILVTHVFNNRDFQLLNAQTTSIDIITYFKANSQNDIANQDGDEFNIFDRELWVGTGQDLENSYLGLITYSDNPINLNNANKAFLVFFAEREEWIYTKFDIYLEDSRDFSQYDVNNQNTKPSTRRLTTLFVSVEEDVKWERGKTYKYEITNIVREYLSKYGSTNKLSVIVKGSSDSPFARKYPATKLQNAPFIEIVSNSTASSPTPTLSPTNTSTPIPTRSPSPSFTNTPTSTPTFTTTITNTNTPTPTDISSDMNINLTPSGGFGPGRSNNPEVGIRLDIYNELRRRALLGEYDRPCREDEHDPTKWHSLVNPVAKCHYDHFHGDDPTYVNDIFGEPGSWFGIPGQGISHPWQTFPARTMTESNEQYIREKRMENDLKHEGYVWIVRRDQPCNNGYCVTDFRVLIHNLEMHAFGAATRFHSGYGEFRVCQDKNRPETCGIIRTGGWLDHGNLITPPSNTDCWESRQENIGLIRLNADNQYYPFYDPDLIDEFRCHKPLNSTEINSGPNLVGNRAPAEWWAHGASDFRYQFLVYNPIGSVTETSPGSGVLRMHAYCTPEQNNCPWTQSVFTIRIAYILPVNSYFVEGFVDGNRVNLPLGQRYITRFGEINPNCSSAGLDCIPIEYSNLTLNTNPNLGLAGYNHESCDFCEKVNHDLTPPGRPSWVRWYYKLFNMNH